MKNKTVLFILFLIFILLMPLSNCSKDNDNDDDNNSTNDTISLLQKTLQDKSDGHNNILDVPPIPIPERLLQVNDEKIKQALKAIEDINNYLEHPWYNKDTSSTSKKSTIYPENDCVEEGSNTVCTSYEHHATYTETLKEIYTPFAMIMEEYITGQWEDIDFGDEPYLIQKMTITNDLKSYSDIWYHYPVPPESAGSKMFLFSINVLDEYTIYTPWSKENYRMEQYILENWWWDESYNKNIPQIVSITEFDSHISTSQTFFWSVNKEDLFLYEVIWWNFDDHTYNWITYDENGNVTNYCDDGIW